MEQLAALATALCPYSQTGLLQGKEGAEKPP